MKRCPQCHFTFSDDQQICDFDHSELTFLEEPPSNIPVAPSSRLRGLLGSRFALGILALVSALSVALIGYILSVDDAGTVVSSPALQHTSTPLSNTPRAKAQLPLIDPTSKTNKPRTISTQRKLTRKEQSASMPSSILKWEPETATARAKEREPVSKRAVRAHVGANKRLAAASNKSVRTKSARSNKEMYARNHEGTRSQTPTRKDSKVVAILKKTGSILTRPFRF